MTQTMEFHCNNNAEHPLGKGEVVSSILTGSTRKARKLLASYDALAMGSRSIAQNEARNAQLDSWKNRGVCSMDVLTVERDLRLWARKQPDAIKWRAQSIAANLKIAAEDPSVPGLKWALQSAVEDLERMTAEQ